MELAESSDYATTFERAWKDKGNTAIDLPAVDVNEVLSSRYTVRPATHFTGASLWDMEVKKASAPDIYLPALVRPRSVERFPSKHEARFEYFTRVSDQRLWLDDDQYGTVIEHVQLDHANRRAFFLGASSFHAPDGRDLEADAGQPIFHVEHSVDGPEDSPLNLWRIVLITDTFDETLAAHFRHVGEYPYLRDFNEVYLRRDLRRDLQRLPA